MATPTAALEIVVVQRLLTSRTMSNLDRFIPEPRLREVDCVDLGVPLQRAHEVIRHIDFARSRIARALFSLRTLPEKISGHAPEPMSMRVDDITKNPQGFRILVDEPDSLVVGAIGKVWQLEIPFLDVAPEEYAAFAEPGWVKVAWEIRFESRGEQATRVTFDLRVTATDGESWQHFRSYFRLIGPFSRFLRRHLLEIVLRDLGSPEANETERSLPGDDRISHALAQATQGVTIDATPEAIWPWLVQMGCGRGGWYSYDRLDNGGAPSARSIVPELQNLRVGDELAATPDSPEGFMVDRIEPGRLLLLSGLFDMEAKRRVLPGETRPEQYWEVSWAFVLEPLDPHTTRLIVRARLDYSPKRVVLRALRMGIVHYIMEHRQLANIKARAEERIDKHVDRAADILEGLVGALGIAVDLGTPFLRGVRSHWGLNAEDAERDYPGDGLVPQPRWSWTHAVTIDAPPKRVWPWVIQIGQDKAGFYSYQWLENIGGCDMQNATTVHPDWQTLKAGDQLKLHPKSAALEVVAVEPGRYFVVTGTIDPNTGEAPTSEYPERYFTASWLFLVEPLDDDKCRFISRYRVTYGDDLRTRLLYGPYLVESVGFVMDRKMLLGVKGRVEAQIASESSKASSPEVGEPRAAE